MDALLANEPAIRLAAFAGVLAVMAGLEALLPRRGRSFRRLRRWPNNLGIVVVDTVVLRLVFPTAAVGVALAAESRGIGLLPWLGLPAPVAVLVAVVLLDLAIYLQHVLFHAVPALWRLHRMHHADPELDATTGLRFHPLEILASLVVKAALVVALGAPPVAVLAFEVLLNATSLFNHADIRIPPRIDRWLRLLLVTPDMHRTHHAEARVDTDSCFGFCLPWWDRIFGSYRAAPAGGLDGAVIGVPGLRAPVEQRLDRLLMQPFRPG